MLVTFELEQPCLEKEKMKTKIDIFSSQKLKNFFSNLDNLFDISLKEFNELADCYNSTNLSIVFLDHQDFIDEKTFKNVSLNKNFIFVYKELPVFEKPSLDLKKNMTAPLSISKFLDKINEIINNKIYSYRNIELNNSFVTNLYTKEKNYLTQAESLILFKLFSEKTVKKKLLERGVLDIKQDLNTSSIESHLNRIRKKLKKINSDFSVSTKNNCVFLEIINQDK